MDDIDVMLTHTQLDRGKDEADFMKQHLHMITKPLQNLNLVRGHSTKEAQNDFGEPNKDIPHLSQHMALDQSASAAAIPYGINEIPQVTKVRKNRIGYRVPMTTEEEQGSWKKFQELAERDNWSARPYISYFEDTVKLDLREPIVPLLAEFAVDAYNAICMEVGVAGYERICIISILEFKYVMVPGSYHNFITFEAIDDGTKCINYVMVQTLPSDGRKTLVELHHAIEWRPFAEERKKEAKRLGKQYLKAGPRRKKALPGKKKDKEAAGGIEPDEKKKVKKSPLAEWNEMRDQRIAALIDPPYGCGLSIDCKIGSYSYLNPLKEFSLY